MQEQYYSQNSYYLPQMSNQEKLDNISAEIIQEERVQNILTQLNPERILSDIEHRIRRMRKDESKNRWVKINPNEPEIAIALVSNVIHRLSGHLHLSRTMSNYTPIEINNLMELVIGNLLQEIDANAEEYNLEDDYEGRNRILEITCAAIFDSLKRAMKGNEANKFWKAMSLKGEIETAEQREPTLKDIFKIN